MAEEKKYMPMSTAGIIGYTEDVKEAIKFKPEHILLVVGIVVAMEVLMVRFFA